MLIGIIVHCWMSLSYLLLLFINRGMMGALHNCHCLLENSECHKIMKKIMLTFRDKLLCDYAVLKTLHLKEYPLPNNSFLFILLS